MIMPMNIYVLNFYLPRYLGEEKVEERSVSSTRADQILKKLHADAEARIKQRGGQHEKSQQQKSKDQSVEEFEEKVKGQIKESLDGSHHKSGQKSKARKRQDTDSDDEVIPVKKNKKVIDSSPSQRGEGGKNDRRLPESDSESTGNKDERLTMSQSTSSGVDIVNSERKLKDESRTLSESEEDGKVADESVEMGDGQEGTYDCGGFTVLGNYKTKTTEKVSLLKLKLYLIILI